VADAGYSGPDRGRITRIRRVRWRAGRATYDILVVNADHRCRGVRSAQLDGAAVDPDAIPIADDGATHTLVVELGEPGSRTDASLTAAAAASSVRR